jgi:hypothetical protein
VNGWRKVGEEPFSPEQVQQFQKLISEARRLSIVNGLICLVAAVASTWSTISLAGAGATGLAIAVAIVGLFVLLVFFLRALLQYSFGGIYLAESESGVNLVYEAMAHTAIEDYSGDNPPSRFLGPDGYLRVTKERQSSSRSDGTVKAETKF